MTLSLEEKENAKKRARRNSADKLSLLQAEVISLFVQACRLFRQPPTLGEIYGLLFISPRPLALDHLIYQLGMSKASASMGLKSLRNSGAIKMVYMPGDRRVHYEAVPELRQLAGIFCATRLRLIGTVGPIDSDRLQIWSKKCRLRTELVSMRVSSR